MASSSVAIKLDLEYYIYLSFVSTLAFSKSRSISSSERSTPRLKEWFERAFLRESTDSATTLEVLCVSKDFFSRFFLCLAFDFLFLNLFSSLVFEAWDNFPIIDTDMRYADMCAYDFVRCNSWLGPQNPNTWSTMLLWPRFQFGIEKKTIELNLIHPSPWQQFGEPVHSWGRSMEFLNGPELLVLNKPMQRKSDFGGQKYCFRKLPLRMNCPNGGSLPNETVKPEQRNGGDRGENLVPGSLLPVRQHPRNSKHAHMQCFLCFSNFCTILSCTMEILVQNVPGCIVYSYPICFLRGQRMSDFTVTIAHCGLCQ